MAIDPKIIDELLKSYKKPEDLLGDNGIFKELKKRLLERVLEEELTHELGYDKNSSKGKNSGNSRNGKSRKTIKGEDGELEIEVPRDRNGDFEPQLVKKRQTRTKAFDDKIITFYARGSSTTDIQLQLEELYGVEVSAGLISQVTNGVMEEVKEWQFRTLDRLYPIVFFDAMQVKMQHEGRVINRAVYLALGVNMDGQKELLGMWISTNEGAKFWLQILTELENRGLENILIACVDGLKGFEEAINSVYPQAEVQLCVVHMIRNSLKYVSYKDRKELSADLKTIYNAKTEDEGKEALEQFSKKWDNTYPVISNSWFENWNSLSTFFSYSKEIRKAIYTTNAIESLNMTLRKVIKNKRSFPSEEAVYKILYLAIRNASKRWTMPIRNWGKAINQLAIHFKGRVKVF